MPRNSTAMDPEAADYFKLDPGQMQLLSLNELISRHQISHHQSNDTKKQRKHSNKIIEAPKNSYDKTRGTTPIPAPNKSKPSTFNKQDLESLRSRGSPNKGSQVPFQDLERANVQRPVRQTAAKAPALNQVPASESTSSLPSVSSSPSLSPSLVCPHLSLDELLEQPSEASMKQLHSAHLVGLCAKCRQEPPAEVHSPLSVNYRPLVSQRRASRIRQDHLSSSDTQLAELGKTNKLAQDRKPAKSQTNVRRATSNLVSGAKNRARGRPNRLPNDDSLDCWLDPNESRRLQMSPTVRHSVGYIRNNTTEAGRVLKIYKNGCPFDKPLRICILRGEFKSLTNLLDYINSRQLVPLGARYLFHLDGQLVYSENELKHGSSYIVSGTRAFDFGLNSVIRERVRGKVNNKSPNSSMTQLGSPTKLMTRDLEVERQIKRTKSPSAAKSMVSVATSTPAVTKSMTKARPVRGQKRLGKRVPSKESLARSNESLVDLIEEPPVEKAAERPIVRAKSELSGLRKVSSNSKKKKNVTFMDTGRGSSPAISSLGSDSIKQPEKSTVASKTTVARQKPTEQPAAESIAQLANSSNDVGIQVSDSIEGFLIDLPIPLPKKPAVRRAGTKTRAGSSAGRRGGRQPATQNTTSGQKVITISERQLSSGELDLLKDMDHGEHHSESHKIKHLNIELPSQEAEPTDKDSQKPNSTKASDESTIELPDKTDTIAIGQEPDESAAGGEVWQAAPLPADPELRDATGSRAERPVSQSEANEFVMARVITPSPSLSTIGDSNSLALSYDHSLVAHSEDAAAGKLLPPKERPSIMGRPCEGTKLPAQNFRLFWVNGFTINDSYPDNSAAAASMARSTLATSADGPIHLSPAGGRLPPAQSLFKPSERFANWLCHSSRHSELAYPVGCLVVLWCRLTGEQRYYARHSSSVSAICLSGSTSVEGRQSINNEDGLQDDVAASAQIFDQETGAKAAVHLWSLARLETLRVVEDLGSRHIFSLRLRRPEAKDAELAIAARDERKLWFYLISFPLKLGKSLESEAKAGQLDAGSVVAKLLSSPTRRRSIANAQTVIKASKPLQGSQVPLMISRLSGHSTSNNKDDSTSQRQSVREELYKNTLVSFGRRHFAVWFIDRRQLSLVALQSSKVPNKSEPFLEAVVRANCMVRLTTGELIVGDSNGQLTLLTITFRQPQAADSSTQSAASGRQFNVPQTYRYHVEASRLLVPHEASRPPVTCLARVSGSLFVSADASGIVSVWRLNRSTSEVGCRRLGCVRLPAEVGFVCSILSSKRSLKSPLKLEFYLVTTSNSIFFGSVQLAGDESMSNEEPSDPKQQVERAPISCNLTVVYEGHEAPAMGLVADVQTSRAKLADGRSMATSGWCEFFTCSLDCKICKWNGKQLVWKSQLPSACASLAIHPIGFVLAVGSADGTVYILDKVSGLLISYFPLTPVCINCLAYSRDGSLLAAGCANGSIFILPVYDRGLKYKKVSILQSSSPVVSIQFSMDNRYLLTSVTKESYQQLILWDLPNFRYMRKNVTKAADKIQWFDSICTGSEDVRAIWENANLDHASDGQSSTIKATNQVQLRVRPAKSQQSIVSIVNLSCHRLTRQQGDGLAIAGDTKGYLRLFQYPCPDIEQGCYEIRISSAPTGCCRFLSPMSDPQAEANKEIRFVSSSFDGAICLWDCF